MKPSSENVNILLHDQLPQSQIIEKLTVEDIMDNEVDYIDRLNKLVQRTINIASPVDTGIDKTVNRNFTPASYLSEWRRISELAEGDLMLQLFAYSPANTSLGSSVLARWQLINGEHSITLLEEYVSDRSFIPDIAAYDANAYKKLKLLEESVSAYEQAIV